MKSVFPMPSVAAPAVERGGAVRAWGIAASAGNAQGANATAGGTG